MPIYLHLFYAFQEASVSRIDLIKALNLGYHSLISVYSVILEDVRSYSDFPFSSENLSFIKKLYIFDSLEIFFLLSISFSFLLSLNPDLCQSFLIGLEIVTSLCILLDYTNLMTMSFFGLSKFYFF